MLNTAVHVPISAIIAAIIITITFLKNRNDSFTPHSYTKKLDKLRMSMVA
jgi:hypothetical protein